MPAYYNENNPFACEWLRGLIKEGRLPDGTVDPRSIHDIQPGDLAGFDQCHFFAGIGGWPLALRLAGWPDDRPVWTGSCPCQPFSVAGERAGAADERHLWPVWERLIRERRPPVVLGEQVEAAIRHGWLDLVASDLEGQGYAVGAAVLTAAGVGAPHRRDRLYWVGDADGGRQGQLLGPGEVQAGERGAATFWDGAEWTDCRDGKRRPTEPGVRPLAHGVPGRLGLLRAYGNAIVPEVAAEFVSTFIQAQY